jgi:hypothetical protein
MSLQSNLHIGQIIRNAIAFNVRNWKGAAMNSDSLLQSVEELFNLLEKRGIDYVLVGGIALLRYVEGRNTQDLDLIMALSSLEKMPELKISAQDRNIIRADYQGLQIDILLTQNPLFRKVQRKFTQRQSFGERAIPIATVEGLLLLKLYALPSMYRQGNFARVGLYENDVATLLHDYQPTVKPLMAELTKHMSETDITEVTTILAEIQSRIDRFKNDRRREEA